MKKTSNLNLKNTIDYTIAVPQYFSNLILIQKNIIIIFCYWSKKESKIAEFEEYKNDVALFVSTPILKFNTSLEDSTSSEIAWLLFPT